MLVSLLGILIVAAVLLDVFLTVLDPDGYSLVSDRVYRWFWWCWRHFARVLPAGTEHPILCLGAPLMIPIAIAIWIAGLVTGFAFIYFGGLSTEDLITGGGSQPSLSSAFRLSWVTLSTIGFVEISPSNMPYSMTVALEAVLGSIVLTLVITYFLNVHHVFRAYNEFVAYVRHHAEVEHGRLDALAPMFVNGRFEGDGVIAQLHAGVAALHEGLRRYAIVYYFRSRRIDRGLPHALATLRRLTSSLSFALPPHPALERSMGLRALRVALVDLVDDLEKRYVPMNRRTVARPVSFQEFVAAWRGRRFAPDVWLERFLDEADDSARAAGLPRDRDLTAAYARYQAWLAFVVRLWDFEEAVRADLGYSERLRAGRSSSIWSVLAQGPKDRPQPLIRGAERSR